MKKVIKGQYSIFDIERKENPSPYYFQRYIGQKVCLWRIPESYGKIVEIENYYTIIETKHGLMCGGPYDVVPAEEMTAPRISGKK